MIREGLIVAVFLGTALAGASGVELGTPAGVGIVFPGEKTTFDLRIELTIEGKTPEVAWEAFLDRLFDFFDRDGDGSLSRAEVGRMFALPLPGRRELVIDRVASRAELKAICRRGGFAPVVLVVAPPAADDQRLGEVLMRHLDTDGDGKISAAELKRAPGLLDRFDSNEDEALGPGELLGGAPPHPPNPHPPNPPPRSGEGGARALLPPLPASGRGLGGGVRGPECAAVLRLHLGAKTQPPKVEGKDAKRLRLLAPAAAQLHRLHGPGGSWLATFPASRATPNIQEASEFVLAQLEAALAGRVALTKTELLESPTVSGLRELFRFADRDGDGRLSLSELKAYLELVALGVRAQTWVTATQRGRNLFHFLDADGDGRLSYVELARAADRLNGPGPVVLPWQVQLSFGGPSGPSWAGVPLPALKRPRPAAGVARDVPRWFQAMDRNGDGVLSPKEFLGPPEVFRRLDADGDGVVTPEEARRSPS